MKNRNSPTLHPDPDPLWYKDAVLYELHVRAFYDNDGDGMGDFRGLTEKLDYLQDLGVTAIWLLPFYPSPLRDDGYDISDYTNVHSIYGMLADFRMLLREAHRRGLRVITELVLNHTSDQHQWFQRARRSKPGSSWRDFYVWNDTPDKYSETRIIFKDFESSNWTWDPVAHAYYWHRFYSHQPDLNFDNPEVRKAMFQAVDFWLAMGVDGLRLDAVPYLFEREGTNCENLSETHEFLKSLRRHVDRNFSNRMLLAEANQWPEDAAAYFGLGDECHMAFHFPLMPRMFMANRMEDRYPIIDILTQTPAVPDNSQWALFLRNHDELTLEMVTDEERDYMYRTYARDPQMRINLGIRRRLAPLLGNDRRKIELMKGLLLSLPGTPVLYYGDEIGMGDNVYLGDRNGVRTPMQWTPDRNAGFSRANSQRLFLPVIIDPDFHYEALNVEAQQNNPNSLWWWTKRLIAMRKRFKCFGRGTLEFLYPENRKVLAFVRSYENELILVVANLSRTAQYVELDLRPFAGKVPVELAGGVEFPPIGELPYLLTLRGYDFYWFSLEPQKQETIEVSVPAEGLRLPVLSVTGGWESAFQGRAKKALEDLLPAYLRSRRWFGGKARKIKSTEITDVVPIPSGASVAYVPFVQVDYTEGDPEIYTIALAFAGSERALELENQLGRTILARVRGKVTDSEGILYPPLRDPEIQQALLEAVARRRRFKGQTGEIYATPTRAFRELAAGDIFALEPSLLRAEQSNTSIVYGDRFILKLFRRVEEGINPDLEIGRFLTERTSFRNLPLVAGAFEYRRGRQTPMTLAILHGYVTNEGDAWQYTLDTLSRYFEQAVAQPCDPGEVPVPPGETLALLDQQIPKRAAEMIGTYLESARLLGMRTAELHLALASVPEDPDFAPEPFSALYQRSIYQSMRGTAAQAFELLRKRWKDLGEESREKARRVLDLEAEAQRRFRVISEQKITAMRMRFHGDYHLGQVLYTGKDFVIIDFEGEPARPLSERRIKRSPLRDVAGMLRSFHYAVYMALDTHLSGGSLRPESEAVLEAWARCWQRWISSAFLRAYLETSAKAPFVPQTREELRVLLNAYLLEKACYELGYELNNRPDWVRLPLLGLLQLLQKEE